MVDMMRVALVLLMIATFALAEDLGKFYIPAKRMEHYRADYGDQAVKRLNSLLMLMDRLSTAPEDQIVSEVNRFFNQVEYQSDIKTWGKKDYWASRLEFLGRGQGDCEDFAVAKFLTMMQLGVPEKKIFLTYVKAVGYPEEAHLVVTYYKEQGRTPLVIDNYNTSILPATQRNDLIPVYSFSANDLFIQKQQGLGKRINGATLKTQQNFKSVDLEILKRAEKK
ncbi:MAG: transglutaminase-like cysteine peptidase [Proteobacteria bacterium]|nr:transglutaminase-like cysteine peptidase [Pseudomonadota bacterium]